MTGKNATHSRHSRTGYKIAGFPVRNMTKRIKLHITKADCAKGNKKMPNSCAAAVALARQVSGCLEARVHIGRVFLLMQDSNKKKFWLRGKTPNSLRTEIVSFDRDGTFEPGEYLINPLSPSERTGKQEGTKPKFKRGRPGHHRQPPRILHNVRGNAHSEYGIK